MLNPEQLLLYIVRPTLQKIGLWSPAAERLVCGTALVESNLEFISQVPSRIAAGLWQMESATYLDLLHQLSKRKHLQQAVLSALHFTSFPLSYDYLAGNLYAGVIFCRLKYYFNPEPLPDASNIAALADYWGRVYNTRNLMMDKLRFIARYEAAYLKG